MRDTDGHEVEMVAELLGNSEVNYEAEIAHLR